MTICIAWKQANSHNIHIAADSKIYCARKNSDIGFKIFSIPISIVKEVKNIDSKTKKSIIFNKQYGIAFAGSYLGMHTLREFLFILLQRLEALPGITDCSFEKICELIHKYAQAILEKVSHDLDWDCRIDFFFTGLCPETNKLQLAKYFYLEQDKPPILRYVIMKDNEYIHAIGSCRSECSNFVKSKDRDNILKEFNEFILKYCNSDKIGGNVQYGCFDDDGHFTIKGIIVTNDGGEIKEVSIGGINMLWEKIQGKQVGFGTSIKCISALLKK